MIGKESLFDSAQARPRGGPKRHVIDVEDHTDEETRAEIEEVAALWRWVRAQRAAGYEPN